MEPGSCQVGKAGWLPAPRSLLSLCPLNLDDRQGTPLPAQLITWVEGMELQLTASSPALRDLFILKSNVFVGF